MQNLETLRQQQPEQRLSWSEAMSVIAPIIDAVGCLHLQRPAVIHGALKPANIIVPKAGDRAVLVDPGMVEEDDPGSTTTEAYACSPGYKAPEQYDGRVVDTRTDVYGLGATFYTLLTGIVPPDGFSRLKHVANGEVDPLQPVHEVLPTVPALVAQAIHQAMALDPASRFSSVEYFWETLWQAVVQPASAPGNTPSVPRQEQAVQRTATVALRKSPRVEQSATSFARKPVRLLIVLLLLIGLVTAVGLGILSYTLSHAPVHPHATTPTAGVLSSTPTLIPTSTPVSTTNSTAARTYNGTMYDLTAIVSTSLSLTEVRQGQGKISGYLIVGPKLQGSGPFRGTIDAAGNLQFIVTDAAGQTMLFFEGAVQSATSLSGDYYSCSQTQESQCSQATGDYGIWSVVLA